jgi:hypothetical protein
MANTVWVIVKDMRPDGYPDATFRKITKTFSTEEEAMFFFTELKEEAISMYREGKFSDVRLGKDFFKIYKMLAGLLYVTTYNYFELDQEFLKEYNA